MSNNDVIDLSPISNLTGLFNINFNNNQISNLQPLNGMVGLRYAYLDNNLISDLQPISTLNNLDTLTLNSNQISDISPLVGMTDIETISLADNNISDISAMAYMGSVYDVNLDNNHITNLEPINSYSTSPYKSFSAQNQEVVLEGATAVNGNMTIPYNINLPSGATLTSTLTPSNGVIDPVNHTVTWTGLPIGSRGTVEAAWTSRIILESHGTLSGIFSGHVTQSYESKVSGEDVTVKYQDENGNMIAPDVVLEGGLGDPYISEQETIPGYTFKEIIGNATGAFTDTEQTIKYVYTKDPVPGADVVVKYQDEDGKEIAPDTVIKGNVGDPYISIQKTITGYTFKEIEGNATGTISNTAQTVKYIYTKDPDPVAGADVTVRYQDGDGNTIAPNVVLSGFIGESYVTSQETIPGYTFKEVQGNVVGIFTNSLQTVTYIYTKDPVVGADVNVKYQDEDGNTIAPDVVIKGNVGDPYTSTEKTITGYTFKEIEGNATGIISNTVQTVKYIYTKNPVVGADVTVRYQDEAGNTIAPNVVLSGNIGEPYVTSQETIPGHTFKEVQGNAVGIFTNSLQAVTYIYTKDPILGENVIVKYQDENGNAIAPDDVLNGFIGEPYVTSQKTIPGYTIKQVQGNTVGIFTSSLQTVTYIYAKDPITGADVTVKYQDEEGSAISPDIVLSGSIDESYSTSQETIPGYTFKELQGNATGTFTDQSQTIKYIYTKDANPVSPIVPIVDPIDPGDTIITGTGEPGATVDVILPSGEEVTGVVNSDGDWDAELPSALLAKPVKGENLPKTGDQTGLIMEILIGTTFLILINLRRRMNQNEKYE